VPHPVDGATGSVTLTLGQLNFVLVKSYIDRLSAFATPITEAADPVTQRAAEVAAKVKTVVEALSPQARQSRWETNRARSGGDPPPPPPSPFLLAARRDQPRQRRHACGHGRVLLPLAATRAETLPFGFCLATARPSVLSTSFISSI
jgi:hypothetical protein